MPIVITETQGSKNSTKQKKGGGGMDIGKTPKKKKPVKAMMGKSIKMKKK